MNKPLSVTVITDHCIYAKEVCGNLWCNKRGYKREDDGMGNSREEWNVKCPGNCRFREPKLQSWWHRIFRKTT